MDLSDEISLAKWKIKHLIKELDGLHGEGGTSLVTFILPKNEQIHKAIQKLTNEMGTAVNIKSRVNRLSVESALRSGIEKLKCFNKQLPNGLVLFSGTANGKRISIGFEPYKPITASCYICDSHFHTEKLNSLIEDDEVFGIVVVDGNGVMIAKLCGSNKDILHRNQVKLPGKTRRGGQSAARLARIREEKKDIYIEKVVEAMNRIFYKQPYKGIIVAGNGNIKNLVVEDGKLFKDVKDMIVGMLDIAYGDEDGLQQAIVMSSSILKDVRFNKEKMLLTKFFDDVAKDSGKISYGVTHTMECLQQGVVSEIIISDAVNHNRYVYSDQDGKEVVCYKENKENKELKLKSSTSVIEYLHENYIKLKIKLNIVSDSTPEGMQLLKGFDGICCWLHYRYTPALEEDVEAQTDNLMDGFI